MKVTMREIMREVRRCFAARRIADGWRVENGCIRPEGLLLEGDVIAISGTGHNDGVWTVGEDGRLDGARNERGGVMWLLTPPGDFLRLCEEIVRYDEANPQDGLVRERFGDYERVRADHPAWQSAFAPALRLWRRMYPGEVDADAGVL